MPLDGVNMLNPQFRSAFDKAVEAESKPLQTLAERKEKVQARVSLLDDIIGRVRKVSESLKPLDTASAVRELTVGSSHEKVVNGTADKRVAKPGVHSIEVLDLASSASAISNGFPDKNETRIGSGYFAFQTANGDTKEVYIDNDNGTLEGVAKAINDARVGMKASVMNDASEEDAPYRLVLAAEGTGTQNDVEYPVFYFVDGDEDFYIDRERFATNARIKYEGMELESSTNKLDDLIPGVSLNLTGTSNGSPARVTIDNDVPKITEKVENLVTNLNDVFKFIQEQNTMDENTDTSRTLGGNYSMRLTEMRFKDALRQNFIQNPTKKIRSLIDLGIEFNRNGTLELNKKKLEDAINGNYEEVIQLISGDGVKSGIITRLKRTVSSVMRGRDGLLSSQKLNYNERIKKFDRDIEKKEAYVEKKAERLMQQLISAQSAMAELQSQTAAIGSAGAGAAAITQLIGG